MTHHALVPLAVAEKKVKLMLEGQAYRRSFVEAKGALDVSLHTHSLIHDALAQAISFAGSHLQAKLASSRGHMQGVLPAAMAVFSFLSRKKVLIPILGVTVVAGAVILVRRHQDIH